MFLSRIQTLPFEGHTMGYQCKGLDKSNIVCEYEVKSVLSLKEKKHNIDFPTLKLPTSTKNLLWLTY